MVIDTSTTDIENKIFWYKSNVDDLTTFNMTLRHNDTMT
jgi:hypothetical protein